MKRGLKFAVLVLVVFGAFVSLISLAIVNAQCPAEMKGYWKLDENPQIDLGAAADESGNGNNGTVNTSEGATNKSVAGKLNSALEFDGIDDYVDIADSPELNPTNEITLEAWINPNNNNLVGAVIKKTDFDTPNRTINGYFIEGSSHITLLPNTFRFGIFNGTCPENVPLGLPLGWCATGSTPPLENGQWYHIVGTYNGSELKLYLDGELIPSATVQDSGNILVSPNNLMLGKDPANPLVAIRFFRGIIDEVAIYNKSLTADEISALYKNSLAKYNYCEQPPTCSAEDRIMKLFQSNNSHGALYDFENYVYDVCYSDIFGSNYSGASPHTCTGTNKVLGLYQENNSHAEIPSLSNYLVDVCYGDLECIDVTDPDPCPADYETVVRLFQDTNSHISNASDTNYEIKICCKSIGIAIEEVYWANMKNVMINQTDLNDLVKLMVAGNVGGKNIEYEIKEKESLFGIGWLWPDSVIAQPTGVGFTTWRAGQIDEETLAEGEFYFRARIEGGEWISTEDNEEPYRYLTVTAPEDNSPPSATIIRPTLNEKFKVLSSIDFESIVEDEDDDLKVTWEFGDGTTKTCIRSEEDCNTTHSYANWGTRVISLTAREIERGQVDMDYSKVFIYDEGTNVFSLITQPPFGEIFAAGAKLVDFDASDSYVSKCVTDVCSPPHGEPCYDVENLQCYDLNKSFIPAEYDLWFNWTFSEPGDDGGGRYGSWSDNYGEVVEFQRAFLEPKTHQAKLKVGYEPVS